MAVGECFVECDPSLPVLAFRSRYSARNVVLPSYAADPAGFANAIIDFARKYSTRVILPTGDGVIATLMPYREQFAPLGCTLALAPNSALEIANDKDRTLEVARGLGIDQPKTMRIDSMDDLPAILAAFDFPLVLKPVSSYAQQAGERFPAVEVIDKHEALVETQRYLDAGASVLAQELATGLREGVTMLMVDGEVLASCGHATYRTSPPLGGVSVVRESTPIPEDIYSASVRLARAIGIEGPCEVEFRRDANNRPLLMEVNARLAATVYNAMFSGVDLPLMTWQWAAGLPVDRVDRPRTGIRTRWLHGDLRWLWDNQRRTKRTDSVSRTAALWTFTTEFVRSRHYDGVDWRDLRPVMAELRTTAAAVAKSRKT